MKMPQGTWSGPCALWRAAPAWQYLGRSSLRLTQGGCAQDALVVRNNDTEVVRLWWPFISKWMGIYTWIYIYLYTLEYIHTYIYTWVNILYTHEYTHTETRIYVLEGLDASPANAHILWHLTMLTQQAGRRPWPQRWPWSRAGSIKVILA